jgi:hypothetical protein
MNARTLTLKEIYGASTPQLGYSRTLPPMADVNFRRLYLEVSTGYDIPLVGEGGAGILPIGTWKSRGGGSPPYRPAQQSGQPPTSFNFPAVGGCFNAMPVDYRCRTHT